QLLLARRRRPVAAAARRAPGIAARDRGAVERAVELALVHVQPPPQRSARPPAPGAPLLALHRARRLAEHVRELSLPAMDDRKRLERKPGLDARAADARVALQRAQRPVRGAPARHARTATN